MTSSEIVYLVGQFIGFVAIAVAFLSFQVKDKSKILAFQALASLVWSIHFFMIGAFAGAILNFIAISRNLLYSKRKDWKWLNGVWLPTVFSVIVSFVSIMTRETWFDVILLPSTILSSYSYCLGSERTIRNSSVFVSLTWLVFSIINISVSGIIAEAFNLTSLTIAIVRFRNAKKFKAERAEKLEIQTKNS